MPTKNMLKNFLTLSTFLLLASFVYFYNANESFAQSCPSGYSAVGSSYTVEENQSSYTGNYSVQGSLCMASAKADVKTCVNCVGNGNGISGPGPWESQTACTVSSPQIVDVVGNGWQSCVFTGCNTDSDCSGASEPGCTSTCQRSTVDLWPSLGGVPTSVGYCSSCVPSGATCNSPLVNQACDDGNACTINDKYDCYGECKGSFSGTATVSRKSCSSGSCSAQSQTITLDPSNPNACAGVVDTCSSDTDCTTDLSTTVVPPISVVNQGSSSVFTLLVKYNQTNANAKKFRYVNLTILQNSLCPDNASCVISGTGVTQVAGLSGQVRAKIDMSSNGGVSIDSVKAVTLRVNTTSNTPASPPNYTFTFNTETGDMNGTAANGLWSFYANECFGTCSSQAQAVLQVNRVINAIPCADAITIPAGASGSCSNITSSGYTATWTQAQGTYSRQVFRVSTNQQATLDGSCAITGTPYYNANCSDMNPITSTSKTVTGLSGNTTYYNRAAVVCQNADGSYSSKDIARWTCSTTSGPTTRVCEPNTTRPCGGTAAGECLGSQTCLSDGSDYGACSYGGSNGGQCNDLNVCTGNGTCSNGSCSTGTALSGSHCVSNSCVARTTASCGGVSCTSNADCSAASNGVCGSASGKTYSNGSTNFSPYSQCLVGTPSSTTFPTAGNTANWTCSGSNGGSNSGNCSATHSVPGSVNGVCGSASGQVYLNTATGYGSDNQCSSGTASNTAFPAPGQTVTWTCAGSNGGSNSGICNAAKSVASGPVSGDIKCNGSDSCSITMGSTVTLSWTSTNTSSCSVSANASYGSWPGPYNGLSNAGQSAGPINGTVEYWLNCAGTSGNPGGLLDTVLITVTNQPNFSVSHSPLIRDVIQGGSTTFTINFTSINGFNEPVRFESLIGLPGLSTYSFNPTNPLVSSWTPNTSILTVTVPAGTPLGSYELIVQARPDSDPLKIRTTRPVINVVAAPPSSPPPAAPPPPPVVPPPGGPTGSGGPACQQITVSWTDVSGELGYYVYRNTSNSFPGVGGRIATKAADATSHLDTISVGTYYYWVSSYNGNGESSPIAVSQNSSGGTGSSSCDATVTGDKDIYKVNNNIYTTNDCSSGSETPPNVLYKNGDLIGFSINLCNAGGAGENATNIVITDTLINLERANKSYAITDRRAWNMSVTAGWPWPTITQVSGTEPGTLVLRFTFASGSIAPGGGAKLKFEGKLAVPASFTQSSSRFQNSAKIEYLRDTSGTPGTILASTPLLLFSISNVPSKVEIAP